MSCNGNKIDFCRLLQNTYKSLLISFDLDVSADAFDIVIKLGTEEVQRLSGNISQNEGKYLVVFPEFSLPKNTYSYEIIWRRSNGTELLLQYGKYKITNEPQSCNCDSASLNSYTVDDGFSITHYSISETNIFIGEGGSGIPGPKGDKGDKGDSFKYSDFTSEQLEGLRGPQGLQGPQGIQGIQGETGATGAQGVKGDTGSQGLQGIQGVKGDKGDKGDTGATGANGTSVNVIQATSEANAIALSASNPNNIYYWV